MRRLRFIIFLLCLPVPAFAQRELHWDAMQVDAHLDADGYLQIVETQTMVFTGDWNGGERKFNIRPRQRMIFAGIYRDDGGTWRPLSEGPSLNSVNDYGWTDSQTLRWRSRLPTDQPFRNTALRYQLRYDLSGILAKTGDSYLLDHDFAFPDRVGTIAHFELRLTLDPVWQPTEGIRDLYTADNLRPGQSFVLRRPLRYTGAGTPRILDETRPPPVRLAVLALFSVTGVALIVFFKQEQSYGRFKAIEQEDRIDESWLRAHILNTPAELVGAAWDDRIGQPEVVALLARLTSEGKLASEPSGSGRSSSMTLQLKVDRSKFSDYERKLIDQLFFDGKTRTSTDEVKSHYQARGFNPVSVIEKDLRSKVRSAFPFGDAPRRFRIETLILFLMGALAFAVTIYRGSVYGAPIVLCTIGSLAYAGIAAVIGSVFRSRMDWGPGQAVLFLIPGLAFVAGAIAFLWFYVGTDAVELEASTLAGVVLFALAVTNTSINSLRSRQKAAGIAARKMLTAARAFFVAQLRQRQPELRDEWYPWVLAFGLSKQVDDWSARNVDTSSGYGATNSSATSGSSSNNWTGFSGGRSGGGGGGASWAAAAGGIAAGVAAPSSSGSGGGGGSSGGGSSGGGGGGGW